MEPPKIARESSLMESGNIDWPVCVIHLGRVDMSKEIPGWQCSNKHPTVVCNDCFADIQDQKCPVCRAPIPDTKDIRSLRRRLGLKSMALKIAECINKLGQLGDRYSAPEIRNVYLDRLIAKAQEAQRAFLLVLKKQAHGIVSEHFLIESKEEEEELAEMDALMMIVEGHEKFSEHPIGKLIGVLKIINKKRAIEKLQEQHQNAIII